MPYKHKLYNVLKLRFYILYLPIHFIIFCGLLTYNVHAQNIKFLTHYLKPLSYQQDENIQGFAVDVVKAMMVLQQHSEEMELYPFPRALDIVQSESQYAFFPVARRPEREETVKWVGPLVTSEVYFYKKRGNPINPQSLQDVKDRYIVGVQLSNADHQYLKMENFPRILATDNQARAIKMLERGRIDLIPISEMVLPEMAKAAGVNLNDIERTDVKLYSSSLYLIFSIDTPDSVIAQWQQALHTLKASGQYQQIYQLYLR